MDGYQELYVGSHTTDLAHDGSCPWLTTEIAMKQGITWEEHMAQDICGLVS